MSITALRSYIGRYFLVIKDSIPVLLFIFAYIAYFSMMGQRIFQGTMQGVMYFDTFFNSLYNMIILLTTANYPDIMLPSYQVSHTYFLFFFAYLAIGLFLILNLLLAIFYSNFKYRFNMAIESNQENRSKYLFKMFRIHGGDTKGYLNKEETFHFFCDLHLLISQKKYGKNDKYSVPRSEMQGQMDDSQVMTKPFKSAISGNELLSESFKAKAINVTD